MSRAKLHYNIDGVLLLDKSAGMSSNAALQEVKRIYQARKAGHTGSLDPLATGLLPICLGQATKVSAYLLDADKHYITSCRLGVITATADADGEVIETRAIGRLSERKVQRVLKAYTGEIQQLPPMYSALKYHGKRLYKLARQGIDVERKPRCVCIHSLQLLELNHEELVLEIRCSKGTYIRTLVEDIGRGLGCGGHVICLRRLGVGPYQDPDMVTLEGLQKAADTDRQNLYKFVLPPDSALSQWPEVHLNDELAFYIRQGQAVQIPGAPVEGIVRIYNEQSFLGMGRVLDDGRVAPKRLLI